jgi:hypothetical protein
MLIRIGPSPEQLRLQLMQETLNKMANGLDGPLAHLSVTEDDRIKWEKYRTKMINTSEIQQLRQIHDDFIGDE